MCHMSAWRQSEAYTVAADVPSLSLFMYPCFPSSVVDLSMLHVCNMSERDMTSTTGVCDTIFSVKFMVLM